MAKESHSESRRRTLIVDRPMQYSMLLLIFGALVLTLLLAIATSFVLPEGRSFEQMYGDDVRRMIVELLAGFFAITFLMVGAVAILLSHRVAGPATALERAVHGLKAGDYTCRVSLRRNDYLKRLASALGELQGQMARNDQETERTFMALQGLIEKGDLAAAQDLLAGKGSQGGRTDAASEARPATTS